MIYIQLSIVANLAIQEILISQLSELDAEGFEQKEDILIAYFNETTYPAHEVNNLLKPFIIKSEIVKEQNWNSFWESNFEPVIIKQFCTIRADFHTHPITTKHEIIITPKMSFGTGHHATTYLMIEQMESLNFINQSVFDFGTGTGILAILAEKLGAVKITAIDIDEWSKENAKENIERNHCTSIQVNQSSMIPHDTFDIILANINRNVLLEQIKVLKKHLYPNGYILLSGILTNDEDDIVQCCLNENLFLLQRTERNSWLSMLFASPYE